MGFLFNSLDKYAEMEPTTESEDLIMTASILESASTEEIQSFLESAEASEAVRENILLEKTIVRLDKKAQISQARKMSIFTIAKEKNDPAFKKLLTIWRIERSLESKLEKKYGNEATRRAKKTVQKRKNSRSPLIKKTVTNTTKVLNAGQPTTKK